MGFFNDPTGERWNAKKWGNFILYLVFLSVSVWASGESIARSFDLPILVCYVFAFVMSAGAAFGLMLIHRSITSNEDGKLVKALFGTFLFLFLWGASFLSNTHNFYYVGAMENIRNNELTGLKNNLELIESKGVNSFRQAREEFRAKVESEIENMKNQITNLGDPGRGEKTEKIIIRIEKLLGEELTELNPPGNDLRGLRLYADQYATMIRKILEKKLASIDKDIEIIQQNIKTPEYSNVLQELNVVIEKDPRPTDEVRKILRKGYAYYNKLYEYIEDLFRSPFLKERSSSTLNLQPLPETPESIDLEHIANSWKRIFAGNYDASRFWIAVIFALVIDLASFGIWYYGILNTED